MRTRLRQETLRLQNAEEGIAAASPQRILRLGFAIVRAEGRAVRSVEALRSSRSLTIELADGTCSIDRDDTSLSPANRQHNLP